MTTINKRLPFADYLALPAVHSSALKAVDTSPAHYLRAAREGRADNDTLRLGRLTHAAILTPDMPEDVAVWSGGMRRGKAWDAFCAEHAGRFIVRREDLATAYAMRQSVLSHPAALHLLSSGDPEVSILWRDETGLDCKARVDWLRPRGIVELKTARSIVPRAFSRAFAAYYYHAQLAFYRRGLDAAGHEAAHGDVYVIAVESSPPHDVAVYRIGDDALEAGARKVETWLRAIAECEASGRWPGIGAGEAIDLSLPAWAETDGLEDPDMSGAEVVDHG